MAQKVIVLRTDDVDGSEADAYFQFAVDGTTYEIDLSAANAEKFRAAVAPWVAAARRLQPAPARSRQDGRRAAARADAATVRAWAREHGYPDLPSHGRIPGDVRAAYEAAHAAGGAA